MNTNNQLDETVKKSLNSYEAPFNSIDWAQMESMLEVAPNQNSLSRSYSPHILTAVAIIAIGCLLYAVFKPSDIKKMDHPEPIKKAPAVSTNVKSVSTRSVMVNTQIKTQSNIIVDTIIKGNYSPFKTTKKSVDVIPRSSVLLNALSPAPIIKKTSDLPAAKSMVVLVPKPIMKSAEELKNDKVIKKENLLIREAQQKKDKALKKEAQLKKEKALKKEIITPKTQDSDTVHLEDENDSNNKRTLIKVADPVAFSGKEDTAKARKEKNKREKEAKKAKKNKKTSSNDSVGEKDSLSK